MGIKKENILRTLYITIILLILIILSFFVKGGFFNPNTKSGSTVRIVYITDNYYVNYLRTSIRSVIANKNPQTKVQIYVIGCDLTDENTKKIKKEKKKDVKIQIVPAPNEYINSFTQSPETNPLVSRADNAKFILTTLLKDLSRVIYLDGDTIVLKDLSDLYNQKLGNNYIAATDDWQTSWADNTNKRYFNNGVMLLNLNEMRKDNIDKKLANYKRNDKVKRFVTQDAFNGVMYGKVLYLPLIYDTFAPEYDSEYLILLRIKQILKNHYQKDLYLYEWGKNYLKDVVIIHYCGYNNIKPWHEINFNRKSSRIWYKYAPLDFWLEYFLDNNKRRERRLIKEYKESIENKQKDNQ